LRLPGPAPAPRHSELRQPAPRALSRAVGWWRCRHGASRALTQTCRPQPRQIDATRGQWRCPKVLTGCRTAAGRPQSLRTRPCLAQSATGSLPRRRGATARVPYWELLLHPTRQVGSRHATHATATRHDRHAAPARHVGHRVTRQAAAVTQPRRRRAAAAARPIAHRAGARAEVDRRWVVCFFLRAAWLEQEARSRAWLCPPRRHKRASAPLRRLAATRSARSLPCEWLPHARQPAAVLSPQRPLGQLPFRGALEASWQGLGAPGLGWF